MKNISYMFLTLLASAPLLAATEEAPMPPPDQGFWQTLVMIAIALAFFYMILWRPEQKRRKAMEQQRSALKKGDRVTAMGIIGTVSNISENTIVLKMIDGAKIEFLKAAITDVIPDEKEEPKKEEK
jgi:preprotein translocase subunit YajC